MWHVTRLFADTLFCPPSLCCRQDLNQEVTLEEFVKMMTPRMGDRDSREEVRLATVATHRGCPVAA
jgi:hypothetical protein